MLVGISNTVVLNITFVFHVSILFLFSELSSILIDVECTYTVLNSMSTFFP